MAAIMDKMYIKLDQKKYPISPRFIMEEVEDKIGKGLDKVITGEEIDHLVETVIITIEDMEDVEVIFKVVIFKAGLAVISEEIIVEIEKIEGHGGSLDQEKEEGGPGHHPVLDQVQELA